MIIILEGASKVGKTQIAKALEEKGYKYIKFNKPNEKYLDPNFTGKSYYDSIMDMLSLTLTKHQDIVFDRSPLSELVYSDILRKGKSQLNKKQFEEIYKFIISSQMIEPYLMIDEDKDSHWNRHLKHYNDISKEDFNKILNKYVSLSDEYDFKKVTKKEIMKKLGIKSKDLKKDNTKIVPKNEVNNKIKNETNIKIKNEIQEDSIEEKVEKKVNEVNIDIDYKIEMANIIKKVIKKRIIQGKTEIHDILEENIKDFLNEKLEHLFSPVEKNENFTQEESEVLKMMAQRVLNKTKGDI
jgi:hypothetical protein